ncbi:hypothetical protein K3G39_02615, partial [Pontibacter sp. HSC-14F20]|uniref:hypothetical protein n=1 Tax=Pontibacter sp. HSC-14F20 TaxID=2864136 RepID=UPI001C72F2EF
MKRSCRYTLLQVAESVGGIQTALMKFETTIVIPLSIKKAPSVKEGTEKVPHLGATLRSDQVKPCFYLIASLIIRSRAGQPNDHLY